MRKALWVIPAILVAAIAAPVAHADTLYTYTYTYTGDPSEVTFTTEAIAGVTAQTTIYAADLASYALTGSYRSGTTLDYVVLDFGNNPGTKK